ncbi:MAG: gamma-glutamyltransferase [Gammaproteobacteria bacterium]|nr:gamma-glutamyltransferase [Gammaproteobacteria bacterium]
MKKLKNYILLVLLVVSPVSARQQAAIASAHPLATRAGEEILAAGGNAFDAAVAITAALAVVEPYSSGIGGGGFWLLHRAEDGHEVMLDGRERAPFSAHRDMYLDKQGDVIKGASVDGALSAGIPGVPAAMVHLVKQYGRLSLQQALQPAIRYAKQGFKVDAHYRRMAGFRLRALQSSKDAAAIFLRNNKVPAEGDVIRQPELATTLEKIASQGAAGFYSGELAQKLVKGVTEAGGIWQLKDLSDYKVIEREPLRGEYRGMKITSVAPPSSGGVALVEIFNQLSAFKMESMGEADVMHRVVESMRRAYRDRAEFLGDTDFVDVPMQRLMDPAYAQGLAAGIHPDRATPSELLPGIMQPVQGQDTTHFSIIDNEGNRVAATLSINYPFGACFVVPGTGVLLNDEMDDFSAKPGEPNVYGLVGAEANAIAPGKRMLSSMSPSFFETDDRVAVMGTPGGSRIITMVLLGALEFLNGADAKAIVDLPRYHHQYLPDKIFVEPILLGRDALKQLEQKGHLLQAAENTWGNMQLVIWDKRSQQASAASDYRGVGEARVIR